MKIFVLTVLLLHIVVARITPGGIPSLFEECDVDGDHSLNVEELRICFGLTDKLSDDNDEVRSGRLIHPLLRLNIFGANPEGFIRIMDKNKDGVVQWDEYMLAIKAINGDEGFPKDRRDQNQRTDRDSEEWFDDEDDGEDFVPPQHDMNADDAVQVTLRDGTVKHISQRELYELMGSNSVEQERAQRVGGLHGNIFEDEENDFVQEYHKLDSKLHDENPGVSHLTQLTVWAVERLKNQDIYPDPQVVEGPGGEGHRRHIFKPRFPKNARLLRLASLPDGGSPNREEKADNRTASLLGSVVTSDTFEVYLEIAVQPNGQKHGPRRLQKSYEIFIKRDPLLYRYPHLAIRGVWELSSRDGSGGYRIHELELPLVRLTRARNEPPGLVGDVKHAWDVIVATLVDTCAVSIDFAVNTLNNSKEENGGKQDPGMVLLVVLGLAAAIFGVLYILLLPLIFATLQWMFQPEATNDHEHQD